MSSVEWMGLLLIARHGRYSLIDGGNNDDRPHRIHGVGERDGWEENTTVSRSIVSVFFVGKYPSCREIYPIVVLLVAVVEFDGRR